MTNVSSGKVQVDPKVVEAHRDELAAASIGKSCIRFAKPEESTWESSRR